MKKGLVLATVAAAVLTAAGCASQNGSVGLSCKTPQAACKGLNACKGNALMAKAPVHRAKKRHHRRHATAAAAPVKQAEATEQQVAEEVPANS